MKKMFTLLVSLLSVSLLFAQPDRSYDNRWNNNPDNAYNNRKYNDNNDVYNRPDHAVEMRRDNNNCAPNESINSNDRRAQWNRVNQDYDRRIDSYGNNRNMSDYNRRCEIERLKKERAAKLKSFGGGIILGGVLGVLLGTQL